MYQWFFRESQLFSSAQPRSSLDSKNSHKNSYTNFLIWFSNFRVVNSSQTSTLLPESAHSSSYIDPSPLLPLIESEFN